MPFQLRSLADTHKLAKLIAGIIVPNFVIALSGDLGAGKTTLVREILHALGISGSIKSPTFTYVEPYKLENIEVYHFDLYRISDPEEWFDLGFDEYFINPHLCFIEWAEKAEGVLPQVDWSIILSVKEIYRDKLELQGNDEQRRLQIVGKERNHAPVVSNRSCIHGCQIMAHTNKGQECLENLMKNGASLLG
ncbi:MAG TPA: tRNA (adenosine(37)-N6)-threonylcarbamoyltransferase complex ATPase subunit type 1 TsaE [Aquella sp.]|nr:tRNA (adenosine(37)-N6)-threonylcarbamoyltransferase complex ATPase subunit type 1 TsaE [Aquella sp.]